MQSETKKNMQQRSRHVVANLLHFILCELICTAEEELKIIYFKKAYEEAKRTETELTVSLCAFHHAEKSLLSFLEFYFCFFFQSVLALTSSHMCTQENPHVYDTGRELFKTHITWILTALGDSVSVIRSFEWHQVHTPTSHMLNSFKSSSCCILFFSSAHRWWNLK